MPTLTPAATLAPTPVPTPRPTPTISPPPVNIHHPPPYTIALEAGHGGPNYTGAVGVDSAGRSWIEKDLTLAVAQKLDTLLTDAGYNVLMLRSSDSTITDFDPGDYAGSVMREAQARVDLANAARADALVSIHFNGWATSDEAGTEAYCDPDRPFADESCNLGWMIQQWLVHDIRTAGYDVNDRGEKNDSMVNGNPNNPHSWMLGTNDNFQPSLMPGAIVEALFLTNPDDLAFVARPEGPDVIARAYLEGIQSYFDWLNGAMP